MERDDSASSSNELGPAQLTLSQLFLRFLRFGALAWGGPVAQIAMLRHSLVDQEHWVSSARFNRTLAVYQVLPGPEAQELAVFFGVLARGRLGGLLAGLGFMLPGFVLMFGLAWWYLAAGIDSPVVGAAFAGCQAAVVALVLRGLHRIGARVVNTRFLLTVAAVSAAASLAGFHFAISLVVGGLMGVLAARGHRLLAALPALVLGAGIVLSLLSVAGAADGSGQSPAEPRPSGSVSSVESLGTGLKAGFLTFGGAYTAIPFVRGDAVGIDGWMTDQQFLDGLALAGVIPAPLIIFGTFVGFVGGGPAGAVALTVGMFLPAFAMTLVGHRALEAVVDNERFHALLDGIAAAVVGVVAITTLQLANAALTSAAALVIFAIALIALYVWKPPWAVAAVIFGAALLGIALLR